MAEGEEVQDQSPLAEHGAGRASRLAERSVGWGMRTKWRVLLANDRKKLLRFIFSVTEIAQRLENEGAASPHKRV